MAAEFDLPRIRRAIAAQVVDGVQRELNSYGGYLPGAPILPVLGVVPAEDYINYYESFGPAALGRVDFNLWVVCPAGPDVDGQIVLDEFMSWGADQANSVIEAVKADPTFGGVVETSVIRTGRHLGDRTWGGPDSQTLVVIGEWPLEVHTRRAV